MYLSENHQYPPFNCINGGTDFPVPHDISPVTINELSPYLGNYALVVNTGGGANDTKPSDYPAVVQCPFAADFGDELRGPFSWVAVYTGYAYYGRLQEAAIMTLIPPERSADRRGTYRAVLWADPVVWYGTGQDIWYYTHSKDGYRGSNFLGFWHTDTESLWGFHRGYTDGSVVWDDASTLDLNLANKDTAAGSKLSIQPYYWWF